MDFNEFVSRLERRTYRYNFARSIMAKEDYLYHKVNYNKTKFSLFYNAGYMGQKKEIMRFYGKVKKIDNGVRVVGKFKIPLYAKTCMFLFPLISIIDRSTSSIDLFNRYIFLFIVISIVLYFFEKLAFILEKPYKSRRILDEFERIMQIF